MSLQVATLTGLVDLASPAPIRITPAAIAFALARQNRWAGNTELPVSIAQHSVLVHECFCRMAPAHADASGILALLHDAHEYLIGDITTPVLRAIEARLPGTADTVHALKAEIDVAIRCAFGLPAPEAEVQGLIDAADLAAAAIEWQSCIAAENGPCPYGPPPRGLPQRIRPQAWPTAETAFLELLHAELAGRERGPSGQGTTTATATATTRQGGTDENEN